MEIKVLTEADILKKLEENKAFNKRVREQGLLKELGRLPETLVEYADVQIHEAKERLVTIKDLDLPTDLEEQMIRDTQQRIDAYTKWREYLIVDNVENPNK